jgi:hypothetical protein
LFSTVLLLFNPVGEIVQIPDGDLDLALCRLELARFHKGRCVR